MGRFITSDTIGVWGDPNDLGNTYAYCSNNPIACTDPTGTCWGWAKWACEAAEQAAKAAEMVAQAAAAVARAQMDLEVEVLKSLYLDASCTFAVADRGATIGGQVGLGGAAGYAGELEGLV